MKVVAIYGGCGDTKEPAKGIMDIACNTLRELQVEVEEVNLYEHSVPYYSHKMIPEMDEVFAKIQEAEAIILGSAIQLLGVSGPMQVFLDYASHPTYRTALQQKYILSIAISHTWGEREAGEQLLRAASLLGALEVDKIIGRLQKLEDLDEELKGAVEKRIEDFYRIIRQKRKNLPVSEGTTAPSYQSMVQKQEPKSENKQEPQGKSELQSSNRSMSNNDSIPDYGSFTDRQKADIEELAELFKVQLGEKENEGTATSQQGIYERPMTYGNLQPNKKTCQQMTASLPHYFQPHLATEFKGIFQLNISGEENFQMILNIDGQECTCQEGVVRQADITIQADSEVWTNVIKGKVSVQKAFMIGQLKVRGNFMILNKIDQLFKKM